MHSKWAFHGVSWKFYSRYGKLRLVFWDELEIEPKRSKEIWSIVDLKASSKRKGYGTKLVKAAIRKAKKHNVLKLCAIPAQTNEAISFWKTFNISSTGGYLYCTKRVV